jgi:hypothetical protein
MYGIIVAILIHAVANGPDFFAVGPRADPGLRVRRNVGSHYLPRQADEKIRDDVAPSSPATVLGSAHAREVAERMASAAIRDVFEEVFSARDSLRGHGYPSPGCGRLRRLTQIQEGQSAADYHYYPCQQKQRDFLPHQNAVRYFSFNTAR